MVSKQDKTLVMVTVVFWAIMFMILMAARAADARVALNEPAAYSVGSDGCSMYVDGCAFANQMSGVPTRDADVERSYYLSIKDGAAMGIDAFGLDMTANTTHATWLLARLSAAMKKYNGENAAAKKCIFVSYRATGGEALAMFNAADSNNSSDSPYCAIEGKPLVGVRLTASTVDPLPGLSGKGPFVVIATMSNATDGVPTKVAVDTWKASGASRVIAYPDMAADMNLSATAKATATAAGATFAYGIPSSWARQCGGSECRGPAAAGYTFRDGKGFLAATAALQASLKDPTASVVFPFAFPGRYDEDVSWESAKVCDANDTVAKSGFTCSALPAHLRGTIPTGNAGLSNSNKSFSKAGFTSVGRWWAQKFKATADPAANPFVAWSHREHPVGLGVQESLTLAKSWVATTSTADYSYFAPANSTFVSGQNPWGHWDMAPGDVFNAQSYTGSNGFLRHRVITGPLRVGSGLPKGAPNVTFGDHFDYRPAVRPLGNGVWSNAISELKASVGGTATAGSTGGYARALQIHGFRTAYTGSDWLNVSSTDGDTYDIQIRYKTNGAFPLYGGGGDEFRERKQIGPHTWDIYRTGGGWTSDLGLGFVLTSNVESITDVDIKAILDYTLADSNARYNRNDTGIYVRGVQAWLEPHSGTIDATMEGMTVRYNGTTYGVPFMGICPAAEGTVLDAKSLSGGGADAIYLTSYSADPVRVRASIGSTVLGTYTLPARQLDLETDARQIAIPLGANRGRPKFEVLDSAGNVITSRDSDVTYTDTPTQRNGVVGRNLSVYADSMPLPVGTSAAKASVVKVSADRAEGNAGTSVSTFRVTLDKPAPANATVNWAVSSNAANATDFYQIEETDDKPTGPQCTNIAPPPGAAAIGATQLAFCDDFSKDSVARGTTAEERNITGEKKWSTERTVWNTGVQPAGDFRHDAAAGTMRIAPSVNHAQSAMQSVVVRNGQVKGFFIGPWPKYYVEMRYKLESAAGGQPAFWHMDLCHWLSRPYTCAEQSSLNEHLEIDLSEYSDAKPTIHKWREVNAGKIGVATGWADKATTHVQCNGTAPGQKIGEFNTFGWSANNSVATFYKNNVKTQDMSKSKCSGIPFELLHKGRQPILIGGKVKDVIVMDFVRVWKAP